VQYRAVALVSLGRPHPEPVGGAHRQRIERRIAHMELRPDEPAPILKDQVVMVGGRLDGRISDGRDRPRRSLVGGDPDRTTHRQGHP
jgi:hypothetical protein